MRDTPHRFRPVRRLGQNFLVNQGAADTIIAAFRPRPDDLVLEVGPGRGALTRRLAGRVSRLVAVEIVQADVLDLDLAALLTRLGATTARRARVIANLPYSIATTVILSLIVESPLLSDLLVLVQREVAERIASPHGRKSYGGLSVLCQARARVETLLRLRPGSFRPIPKVESVLVRLTLHHADEEGSVTGGAATLTLETLLRAAFAQRRKTLLNNLARLQRPGGGPIGPAGAADVIRGAGLDPRARPEEIPVGGFLALLRALRAL